MEAYIVRKEIKNEDWGLTCFVSVSISLCIWKIECILQAVLAKILTATPQTEALA